MDAVGHRYGGASKEAQDAFIRLDQYLGELFDYLDEKIGMEQVLVFLTSDHGAIHVPEYLADQRIPSVRINFSAENEQKLRQYAESTYGQDFIIHAGSYELYYDLDYIDPHILYVVAVH